MYNSSRLCKLLVYGQLVTAEGQCESGRDVGVVWDKSSTPKRIALDDHVPTCLWVMVYPDTS